VGPLLTGVGDLETKDTGKAEALGASFDSVFTDKSNCQDSQVKTKEPYVIQGPCSDV